MAIPSKLLKLALAALIFSITTPAITEDKPRLILLTVKGAGIDRDVKSNIRVAIEQELSARYTVFSGSQVDKKIEREFVKQCRIYQDDAEMANSECMKVVAGFFVADYLAIPHISQQEGGYLLTLEIRDAYTSQSFDPYSGSCVGCSVLELADSFRAMIAAKNSSGDDGTPEFVTVIDGGDGSSGVSEVDPPPKLPAQQGQLALLLFDSVPSGAEVWLGDIKAGTTPYQNLQLKPGQKLNLTLKAQDYRDLQVALTLQPGSNTPKAFQLVPAFGSLSITSEPSGADVYLSGELVGQTPYSSSRLASAKYLVDIRKPLYLPLSNQTIAVEDGKLSERSFKLQPNFGDLSVASEPSAATITLEANGREVYRGTTPISLQLEPATYLLSASKSGYAQRRFEVKIARGQRISISKEQLQLRRLSGTAVISSEPASPGARVLIDGKDSGAVPLITELPVGSYEITIKGDKLSGKAQLQIRDGQQQTLVVELQSVKQPKPKLKPKTSSKAKVRPKIRTVSKSELIKLIGSTHSDYTKLDAQGYELPKNAKSWSCVLDNRSGLVWEVKTNDGGARDKDNKYRWGGEGVSDIALRWTGNSYGNKYSESRWDGEGDRFNDWDKLIAATNSEQLCGFSDWRVPDLYELASLVRCRDGHYQVIDGGCIGNYRRPTIDINYFPYTGSNLYWSASPSASYYAWEFSFYSGMDTGWFHYLLGDGTEYIERNSNWIISLFGGAKDHGDSNRDSTLHVRLVRPELGIPDYLEELDF